MKNLFGLTRAELEAEIESLGRPAYRGRQVYRWIYARGVNDFEAMTDLSRELRNELAAAYTLTKPAIAERHVSRDGTIKFLLALSDGRNVETVYIPDGERHTFCLSTQVGCPLKCTFCFSGTIRFERNLEPGEILAQFMLARHELPELPARSNIVFMGMGEPLLNSDGVLSALDVLTDEDALAVSPHRITVSTAGLVDELERFSSKAPLVGLAISLHATTNAVRDRVMPINRKHPIEELIAASRALPRARRRRITFEYVLLGGENDTPADAEAARDSTRRRQSERSTSSRTTRGPVRPTLTLDAGSDRAFHGRADRGGVDGELATKPRRRRPRRVRAASESILIGHGHGHGHGYGFENSRITVRFAVSRKLLRLPWLFARGTRGCGPRALRPRWR